MARILKVRLSLLLTLLVGMSLMSAAPAAEAHPATTFQYTAFGYGTTAFVGNTLKAGRTAVVTLGCTSKAGIVRTNTAKSARFRNGETTVFSTGAINTKAESLANPTRSRTTAQVADVNLLGGLITADLVKAVSTTSHTAANHFATSAAGSQFVALKVGTQTFGANVAPNTRRNLDFGYVILNQQIRRIGTTSAALTVNMIHVVVTTSQNPFNLPRNSHIIVASAKSDLEPPITGPLSGFAYVHQDRVGNLIVDGPSALVHVGCRGTNGRTRTNQIADVDLGAPAGTIGTGDTTAYGTLSPLKSRTTSTVEQVNLLGGLVQATLIESVAQCTKNGTVACTGGATFVDLVVDGVTFTQPVEPNTRVDLTGIGTVYLNRIIRGRGSIEVRAIEIDILEENSLGLPVGTNIRVAVAKADIH